MHRHAANTCECNRRVRSPNIQIARPDRGTPGSPATSAGMAISMCGNGAAGWRRRAGERVGFRAVGCPVLVDGTGFRDTGELDRRQGSARQRLLQHRFQRWGSQDRRSGEIESSRTRRLARVRPSSFLVVSVLPITRRPLRKHENLPALPAFPGKQPETGQHDPLHKSDAALASQFDIFAIWALRLFTDQRPFLSCFHHADHSPFIKTCLPYRRTGRKHEC